MVYRTSPLHWCPEPCFAPAIRCCAFAEAVTFCSMPALNTAFQCPCGAGPSDALALPAVSMPPRCSSELCRRIALLSRCETPPCSANARDRSTMPILCLSQPRQCFARPCVASAPIVAVAGDCSAVPTHCSPMPSLCFGFRPCRASLYPCLAEHNFATATLSRTSLCLGYAVHACAATELCFASAKPV